MTRDEIRGKAKAHHALADHLWEEARRLDATPAHTGCLAVRSLRQASIHLGYAAEGYEQIRQAEGSSSRSTRRAKGAA